MQCRNINDYCDNQSHKDYKDDNGNSACDYDNFNRNNYSWKFYYSEWKYPTNKTRMLKKNNKRRVRFKETLKTIATITTIALIHSVDSSTMNFQ